MNRVATITSGIAALAPVAGFIAVPFVSNAWFPVLITSLIAGGWLITIGFVIFAVVGTAVPRGKRGLWAAVMLFGNFVVLPFFWFWYILKRDAPSANRGT